MITIERGFDLHNFRGAGRLCKSLLRCTVSRNAEATPESLHSAGGSPEVGRHGRSGVRSSVPSSFGRREDHFLLKRWRKLADLNFPSMGLLLR